MKRVFQLLAMVMLASSLSAPAIAGDVPKPHIPPAVKGEKCVEPVEVMRREHMDFLKHHRDEVMHQGIRTKRYSLKQCLDCHVPAEAEASAEDGHFCKNCHVYAGVRLDCFECHNTRPQTTSLFDPMATPGDESQMRADSLSDDLLNKFAGINQKNTGASQ